MEQVLRPPRLVLSKTFTADGTRTHAIGESGLFNSTTPCALAGHGKTTDSVAGYPSCGGMLARQTFTDVSLSDGDSITITWTFTVGN